MSVYTPPATNAVDFAVTSFTPADLTSPENELLVYTPPVRSAVDFALTAYTQPTYPYVGWELLPGASPTNYTLVCAAGAYVYSGQNATLTVARRLALAPGAYTYTGQDAVLDYVPGVVTVRYTLDLDAGAYVYAGQAANLAYTPGAPPPLPPTPYWDSMLMQRQKPTKKKQRKQELEAMFLLLG